MTTALGEYRPGRSPLHRLPAGVKLAALFVLVIATVLIRQPWQLLLPAAAVAAGWLVAAIPAAALWRQVRPMRVFLPVILISQGLLVGWRSALLVAGAVLLSVAAAGLLTLTTRVTAMLDVLSRVLAPLRRVGVDPDRVGLVLALTIRCIPLTAAIVAAADEARKARGARFSIRALAGPAVIRALRTADQLGDALVARGVDD